MNKDFHDKITEEWFNTFNRLVEIQKQHIQSLAHIRKEVPILEWKRSYATLRIGSPRKTGKSMWIRESAGYNDLVFSKAPMRIPATTVHYFFGDYTMFKGRKFSTVYIDEPSLFFNTREELSRMYENIDAELYIFVGK